MGLMDLFRRSTTSSALPKLSKPTLVARMGEGEHAGRKTTNADGGPFLEDWSEGTSNAVRSGRPSFDGKEIVSVGDAGFQRWDATTGALKETISLPEVTGTLTTKGLRVGRSAIDISPDMQSFASFGTQPRPSTQYTDYWSMLHHRRALDKPIVLPGWVAEDMLSGVRFLPSPNRLLRWGYKSKATQLDLIGTDSNTVIDSCRLPYGAHISHIAANGRAFAGWHEGVLALDGSQDKLSIVSRLDLDSAGSFGSGHSHYGVLTSDETRWLVTSRFEGERTGVYRGTLSAWDKAGTKIWGVETSELNPLWREVASLSIHSNDQAVAISVIERDFVIGKHSRLASYVVFINIADGLPQRWFKAHRNYCSAHCLPDGERVLTVSRDECAMNLWTLGA
ncbi:MAG: hypothetical protein AB7P22_00750 [Vicinamibacterales bacterium]